MSLYYVEDQSKINKGLTPAPKNKGHRNSKVERTPKKIEPSIGAPEIAPAFINARIARKISGGALLKIG
ncbi:hypothetical protein [Sulfitobacter sp. M22]|uniref:hypothetical protein n=1 Tax=Sulfitobacter sp. M22 TaxID=2675332 RepID=UPI001F482786|nr:hypothetical protein [Sulfitobacter sp. M22]MCF7728696.1 hypothetical protein [Sulfitobacter sp. M22]